MQQLTTLSILVSGAILAALLASLSLAGTVHLASRRGQGYLHWMFYAMVLLLALTSLLSGRDVNSTPTVIVEPAATGRHPFLSLAQPLVSLLLLTVAGERLISHWLRRHQRTGGPRGPSIAPPAPMPRGQSGPIASASMPPMPSGQSASMPSTASVPSMPLLLPAFVIFWLGTVAAPALLGAHPNISHNYVYSLIIGMAAVLVSGPERDRAFKAARNALVLFMAASVLLIAVKPALVLDSAYTQGLLPGVPRLSGLAAHAVSLGILGQLGLLCLLAYPYPRRWLNRLAWLIGLTVLFLAQSKTTWVSFILCSLCILAVRQGPAAWRRMGDPVRPEAGMLSILGFMAAVLGAALVLMFGDLGARLDNFFNSSEGAQLATLTGRDRIWAVAWQEWQQHPWFGYGPTLWESSYRISIGMPNATHAHNQFMDTLSRSGSVGAAALVLYGLVLLVLSVRHARATRGMSLALFAALALRSLSEVPLLLFGYGAELLTHLLLLMTLAAAGQPAQPAQPAQAPKARPAPRKPPSALSPGEGELGLSGHAGG